MNKMNLKKKLNPLVNFFGVENLHIGSAMEMRSKGGEECVMEILGA